MPQHQLRNAQRVTLCYQGCIFVQVTIYRRILSGRYDHLEQSEAYDISYLVQEYGPL